MFGTVTKLRLSGVVIFAIIIVVMASRNGSAATLTTLFSFDGTQHGATLLTGLTLSGSTLYGTTEFGGANNDGTVFALTIPEPSSFCLLSVGIAVAAVACHRRIARHHDGSRPT